jgi:hypothetical protein
MTLDQAGRAWMECLANTGNPAITAFAESRQMTALNVSSVTIQQDPEQ